MKMLTRNSVRRGKSWAIGCVDNLLSGHKISAVLPFHTVLATGSIGISHAADAVIPIRIKETIVRALGSLGEVDRKVGLSGGRDGEGAAGGEESEECSRDHYARSKKRTMAQVLTRSRSGSSASKDR